jgi:hypothetical protein
MSMWYASLIHGVVGKDEQERKGVKREDEGGGKGREKEVDGKDDVDRWVRRGQRKWTCAMGSSSCG